MISKIMLIQKITETKTALKDCLYTLPPTLRTINLSKSSANYRLFRLAEAANNSIEFIEVLMIPGEMYYPASFRNLMRLVA